MYIVYALFGRIKQKSSFSSSSSTIIKFEKFKMFSTLYHHVIRHIVKGADNDQVYFMFHAVQPTLPFTVHLREILPEDLGSISLLGSPIDHALRSPGFRVVSGRGL